MKTINLKLTDAEYKIIDNAEYEKGFMLIDVNKIQILDVDKFRKFLNDEIDKGFPTDDNGMSEMLSAPNGVFYEGSESHKKDNLKSILNKIKG